MLYYLPFLDHVFVYIPNNFCIFFYFFPNRVSKITQPKIHWFNMAYITVFGLSFVLQSWDDIKWCYQGSNSSSAPGPVLEKCLSCANVWAAINVFNWWSGSLLPVIWKQTCLLNIEDCNVVSWTGTGIILDTMLVNMHETSKTISTEGHGRTLQCPREGEGHCQLHNTMSYDKMSKPIEKWGVIKCHHG